VERLPQGLLKRGLAWFANALEGISRQVAAQAGDVGWQMLPNQVVCYNRDKISVSDRRMLRAV